MTTRLAGVKQIVVEDGKKGFRYLLTYPFWKSVFDRIAALLILVILFPILVLIAVAIRIDSPGNPIFAQERSGKGGRHFTIYKFRTMYVNNDDTEFRKWATQVVAGSGPHSFDDNGKPLYKLVDDPRVTKIGSFLRKTNLDELPQIVNILKGDMSFIGPRPEMTFTVDELYNDWHRQRLAVTPGITGLWQVNGRGNVSFDDMVRLDIMYIERRSLALDACILLRTFGVLFGRNGS